VNFLNRLAPYALGVLRIVAGFLFMQHGLQKLFGWLGGRVVEPFSQLWFAGVLEVIGGPLIMLGLLTRPVAFVLAGEMVAAYLIGHAPRGPWPVRNGGVPALLFALIFLHLAAAGAGKLAVDSLRRSASSIERWAAKFSSSTLAVLRIGSGFLFWQYGAMKFAGWFGGRRVTEFGQRYVAGILEFFGGPAIALGLFTRVIAFILSGEMAVAYWSGHFPRGGILPIQNGGEPAALFCFIFLYFVFAGPGPASLDGLRSGKSSR
jgi:putative oxidoreductase